MLKTTGIKLELISDTDKHLFIEKGLRGGISYICKEFSEPNQITKKNKFIKYLDENNLYSWKMSQ